MEVLIEANSKDTHSRPCMIPAPVCIPTVATHPQKVYKGKLT